MRALPGDRVVVRYRLGAGGPADWRRSGSESGPNPALSTSPSLSDLTGVLVKAVDDALVIERDGELATVPVGAITALRQLSLRTVRNSEIRVVQRALSESVLAGSGDTAEQAWVDGWWLSCDTSSSALRANAAVPLELGSNVGALPAIADWFAGRGTTGRLVIPERLLRLSAPDPNGSDPRGSEPRGSEPDEYEVLVKSDAEPVEVHGDDLAERRRLRALGYGLHHTFSVLPSR